MIHVRAFVLAASAISISTAVLGACGDGEPRASFAEEPEDASPPPIEQDAGLSDADADASPSIPDYDASDEPVVCTSVPCVTQLVAGMYQFCALISDGSVRCWGRDEAGSLGRGEPVGGDRIGSRPMPVVGITNATQVSTSSVGYTTCVRNAGGRVQCWGPNYYGQLGLQVSPAIGDYENHATPADVALTAEIARVDVGPNSVCALDTDGNVYCWGYNAQSQLARPDAGTTGFSAYYGPGLADLRNYEVTRIAVANQSVFGLTKDHQLIGWGKVSGRDSSLDSAGPIPFPLPTLSAVTAVDTSSDGYGGNFVTCAIAGGSLYCWGRNSWGALGIGVPDERRLPTLAGIQKDGRTFPQQLALAQNRSCVRMTDGTIQCCGDDRLGQLGRGDAGAIASVFERVTTLGEHAVRVAVSSNATCALVQGGKVMCWGGNENGELGQGTTDSVAHPTPTMVVFQ